MIKTLFGDLASGRLRRSPFLGYHALLWLISLLFVLGVVAVIAGAEALIGGDLQEAQALLTERFGGFAAAVVTPVGLVLLFVGANVTAKRARDIGLPGWLTVAVLVVLGVSVSLAVSQNAAGALNTICWLALLLLPGNLLRKT